LKKRPADDLIGWQGGNVLGSNRPYIFVSHASADNDRLKPVIVALLDAKIPLWFDKPRRLKLPENYFEGHIREGEKWNDVVPAAELTEATQRLAERIAANAPLSVLAAKRTVRLIAEHPLRDAYAAADRIWAPVYHSEDAQEGPAAFRDKRTPVWKGR